MVRESETIYKLCQSAGHCCFFSQEPAFSIEKTVKSLEGKQNTTVRLFTAKHGFLDSYSANYHPETAKAAQQEIICFLNETFE
jgi:dienelactone hydrolase